MATFKGGPIQWRNIDRAITPPTHRVVDDVATNARRRLLRHNRTGALLGSLQTRKRVAAGEISIGTDHWQFIEYGTAPHDIQPTRKRALYWPGARHPVRRVNHPGSDEYAPMRRALADRARG